MKIKIFIFSILVGIILLPILSFAQVLPENEAERGRKDACIATLKKVAKTEFNHELPVANYAEFREKGSDSSLSRHRVNYDWLYKIFLRKQLFVVDNYLYGRPMEVVLVDSSPYMRATGYIRYKEKEYHMLTFGVEDPKTKKESFLWCTLQRYKELDPEYPLEKITTEMKGVTDIPKRGELLIIKNENQDTPKILIMESVTRHKDTGKPLYEIQSIFVIPEPSTDFYNPYGLADYYPVVLEATRKRLQEHMKNVDPQPVPKSNGRISQDQDSGFVFIDGIPTSGEQMGEFRMGMAGLVYRNNNPIAKEIIMVGDATPDENIEYIKGLYGLSDTPVTIQFNPLIGHKANAWTKEDTLGKCIGEEAYNEYIQAVRAVEIRHKIDPSSENNNYTPQYIEDRWNAEAPYREKLKECGKRFDRGLPLGGGDETLQIAERSCGMRELQTAEKKYAEGINSLNEKAAQAESVNPEKHNNAIDALLQKYNTVREQVAVRCSATKTLETPKAPEKEVEGSRKKEEGKNDKKNLLPLLLGGGGGALFLFGIVVFLMGKRKKDEEQELLDSDPYQ